MGRDLGRLIDDALAAAMKLLENLVSGNRVGRELVGSGVEVRLADWFDGRDRWA